LNLSFDSKRFYKEWRESYRWPLDGNTRVASEKRILDILKTSQRALNEKDVTSLRNVLIEIHSWKTNDQRGITEKYENSLRGKEELLTYLTSALPLKESLTLLFFTNLLEKLKIPYSNLPAASAQASFLLNRKTPIIDRFVAQFFSMKISPKISQIKGYNMKNILQDIRPIPFEVEDDGRNICVPRLAAYSDYCYQKNRN